MTTAEGRLSSDRAFGMVMAAAFSVVGLWPLMHGASPRVWAVAIAAVFLLVAVVAPSRLTRPKAAWLRFGLLLSRVTNPVILGAIFFLVVTPIGVISRVIRANPVFRGPDAKLKSYWQERGEERDGLSWFRDQF